MRSFQRDSDENQEKNRANHKFFLWDRRLEIGLDMPRTFTYHTRTSSRGLTASAE